MSLKDFPHRVDINRPVYECHEAYVWLFEKYGPIHTGNRYVYNAQMATNEFGSGKNLWNVKSIGRTGRRTKFYFKDEVDGFMFKLMWG
jgi:hypothetical protein